MAGVGTATPVNPRGITLCTETVAGVGTPTPVNLRGMRSSRGVGVPTPATVQPQMFGHGPTRRLDLIDN